MNIDDVNRAAAAYLANAEGAHAARLEFLKGIWAIQSELEGDVPSYAVPDTDSARDALATHQPLFLVSAPEIPADAFRGAVTRIASYVADHAGLEPAQAAALREADLASKLTDELIGEAVHDPDGFVDAAAALVAGGSDSPLATTTVAFVLLSALTPFLTNAALDAIGSLGEYTWSVWGSGDCPVCGSAAALGRMSESTDLKGGERTLWCSLCHSEWGFERMRCARCGSRTQDTLRYSYEESDPAHRLHLCDACHGYVKFTLQGELDKPLSMVVEEAASVTLDAIARSEGYTPTGSGAD